MLRPAQADAVAEFAEVRLLVELNLRDPLLNFARLVWVWLLLCLVVSCYGLCQGCRGSGNDPHLSATGSAIAQESAWWDVVANAADKLKPMVTQRAEVFADTISDGAAHGKVQNKIAADENAKALKAAADMQDAYQIEYHRIGNTLERNIKLAAVIAVVSWLGLGIAGLFVPGQWGKRILNLLPLSNPFAAARNRWFAPAGAP